MNGGKTGIQTATARGMVLLWKRRRQVMDDQENWKVFSFGRFIQVFTARVMMVLLGRIVLFLATDGAADGRLGVLVRTVLFFSLKRSSVMVPGALSPEKNS
ncbi:hypothetical protein XENOCAPTIV_028399 [Xenoophorus captivus]|uniref:Uncharacterized protein n=1 Tax=Xenoophorus captivus TaxID=1517983 RepID=A0ABV0S8Y8_9TELE